MQIELNFKKLKILVWVLGEGGHLMVIFEQLSCCYPAILDVSHYQISQKWLP